MITKNFVNFLIHASTYGVSYSYYPIIRNKNGGLVQGGYMSTEQLSYLFKNDKSSLGLSQNTFTIILGNGTTQPQADDLWLENQIETLTINSVSVSNNIGTENIEEVRYIVSVTNNKNEDITVSEIGLVFSYSPYYALFCREVFENVTIKPNESKSFSIVLS